MSCQDVSDGDVMKPYILVYRYRVVFDQQQHVHAHVHAHAHVMHMHMYMCMCMFALCSSTSST